MKTGAEFSDDRKHRYALWRIWDESKPLVMFIGLNPSTANETEPDPTIESVIRISKFNGFGGVYMMNCFPHVATKPEDLIVYYQTSNVNSRWLIDIAEKCGTVVFAWGNFKVVKQHNRDKDLRLMFPNAKALHINKNGSPKHPLYCKEKTRFIDYTVTS